jgi:deoxyribonuclease V
VQVQVRHGWKLTTAEARELQLKLAGEVIRTGELIDARLIAGVDMSADRIHKFARAAAVVLTYPELDLAEVKVAEGSLDFPYVPGLLTFREAPLVLVACEQLTLTPDLVLVDGQGIAHPRRFGIAAHLGLLLDVPTIGCAKSLLIGTHGELGEEAGSTADLLDNDEIIGAAVRTRRSVKPVYVSIGHRISLENAVRWTLAGCRRYRLPEPLRMAHLAAGGNLSAKVAALTH